ncbi:LOW QUALITY PROTEIN: coiled-coil domain-containing protein 70 [Ammospiza maritima maritima]
MSDQMHVPTGYICSAVLQAAPGSTELQQPHLCQVVGSGPVFFCYDAHFLTYVALKLSGKESDSKDKYSLRNISNLSLLLPSYLPSPVLWHDLTKWKENLVFQEDSQNFRQKEQSFHIENNAYYENLSVHRQNKVLWEKNKTLQRKHRDSSEETKNLEKQQKACQQNKALREEIKSLRGYEAFALKEKALHNETLAFEKHKAFKDQLRALQEDNKAIQVEEKAVCEEKFSSLSEQKFALQEGNMPLHKKKALGCEKALQEQHRDLYEWNKILQEREQCNISEEPGALGDFAAGLKSLEKTVFFVVAQTSASNGRKEASSSLLGLVQRSCRSAEAWMLVFQIPEA